MPAPNAQMRELLHADLRSGPEEALCNPLTSVSGNVFTVRVNVGSPAQPLDLIVDTGSNSLIMADCKCRDDGWCDPRNKCFRENMSSTLVVDMEPQGPATTVMSFGSGSILARVASEEVSIGGASATMEHGALLMIDQMLNFAGPFEGILGLGLPNSTDGALALRIAEHNHFFDKYLHDAKSLPAKVRMNIGQGNQTSVPMPLPTGTHDASKEKPWSPRADAKGNGSALDKGTSQVEPVIGGGFMRQAGFGRFSVCFTDSQGESGVADGGALRFEPPEAPESLKSIGTMHWGLDFRGVSVGDSSEKLGFCSAAGMPSGQQTPCGAIPDSGTTYIMGPVDQIDTLFEEICTQWPRCSTNYTKLVEAAEGAKGMVESTYGTDPWGIEPMSKISVFQMLLQDCDSWINESEGMNELPPIHFHVADDTGLTKALTLDGSVYTVSIQEPEVRQVTQHVPGAGDVPVGTQETGRIIWTCQAAFSSLYYPTEVNGPAWILGMPIFHRYTVGFNVAIKPPTISFTGGPCGGCGTGGAAALLEHRAAAPSGPPSGRRPRRVTGRPRIPKIDTTQPF